MSLNHSLLPSFHCHNQWEVESIPNYTAELWRLATHCEFSNYLNKAFCDRLACSIHSENRQLWQLAKKDLSLQKAMDLALGMEGGHWSQPKIMQRFGASHSLRTYVTHDTNPGCYMWQRHAIDAASQIMIKMMVATSARRAILPQYAKPRRASEGTVHSKTPCNRHSSWKPLSPRTRHREKWRTIL